MKALKVIFKAFLFGMGQNCAHFSAFYHFFDTGTQ
jgi:hypothetical protein